MPNANLIQQRDFTGGINDLMPPDTLKDNECLEIVNFLPGASGTPLPVRGGTAAYGLSIDAKPVTGLYHFHRSDGEDFVLAVCDDKLYTHTEEADNLIYTFAATGDASFVVMSDKAYVTNGSGAIVEWDGKGVGTDTFAGTGLNDLTPGGSYTGVAPKTFIVRMGAAGTPDTFRWSTDGGSTWSEGVNVTAEAITLSDGVTVTFGATTGHTLGDQWTFSAGMAAEVANSPTVSVLATFAGRLWGAAGSIVYYSGALDTTSWSGGDIDDGGWLYVPQERDDGESVTGLARMFNGVVVFKESNTFLWSYADSYAPSEGTIEYLIPGVGCGGHDTIAYYAGAIYFLGKATDGSYAVYKLQGSGLDEASTKIPQRLADILVGSAKPPRAAIYDHHYYLAIDSSESSTQTRDVVYVLDIRRGGWCEFTGFSVGSFSADGGYLYIGTDSDTGLITRYPSGHTDAAIDASPIIAANPIAYTYKSRPFTSKNAFSDKRYRNVWVDVLSANAGTVRVGVDVDQCNPSYRTFTIDSDSVRQWDDGWMWDDGYVWPIGAGVAHCAMEVPTGIARGREVHIYIEGSTSSPLEVVRLAIAFRERKTRYGGDA